MESHRRLAATARAQHGVFAAWQAEACGISRDTLRQRVLRGKLEREVSENVFAIPGAPPGWRRDLSAACLWAGPRSAASHRSAGRLWALPGYSDYRIEISTVSARRPHGVPYVVHRVDGYLLGERQVIDGIPVTSLRRTLMDLCGRKDRRIERALDHALFEDMTSLGRLWLLYDEEWTRGRRGIAIMRNLLIERTRERAPSDGDCARLFWEIVRTNRLPEPEVQYPIRLPLGLIHVDFAYPEMMLAIETDGYAYHQDKRAFERDRERDAELAMLGWTTLRYTWAKLRFDPHFVARSVIHHLNPPPSGPQRDDVSRLRPLG